MNSEVNVTQLRITVRTMTPLLMYGAHNKADRINTSLAEEPELRATAVRGQLRYWLRAVIANGVTSADAMFTEESKIFGSTALGSRVRVRVQMNQNMTAAGKQFVLPAQTKGFSLPHKAFMPNSRFRITLSTHALDRSDVLAPDSHIIKALFLMLHFGGFGRRSRRGSGNVQVTSMTGYDSSPPMAPELENSEQLGRYLSQIANFVAPVAMLAPAQPDHPVFAPHSAVVLIGRQAHASYEEAFDELWSVSGPYHDARGVFGDVNPRRASAIHMRVSETKAGIVPVQTIMYSGPGDWPLMRKYISHAISNGFDVAYGDWSSWK